jgi:hypothetical protein
MAEKETEQLVEMRCRSCGMFMGYRKRIGRFVFWCSEDCADTPMAKWPNTQLRDEVAVELFLQGHNVMAVARETDTAYQMIQQLVSRRGVPYQVMQHQRRLSNGELVEVAAHTVGTGSVPLTG